MHGTNLRALVAAVGVVIVAAPLGAQNTFDGTVTYHVSMGPQQVEVVMRSKGSKTRQDTRIIGGQATPGFQLIDYATGDVINVMTAQRKYVRNNYKELRAAIERAGVSDDDGAERARANVVNTGRRETIAGHSCTVYTIRGSADEACIATGLGHFIAVEGEFGLGASGRGNSGMPASPALARLMRTFRDGALPLRITFAGTRPTTLTATKVERGSLPNELFVVPAGYTEIKLPSGTP